MIISISFNRFNLPLRTNSTQAYAGGFESQNWRGGGVLVGSKTPPRRPLQVKKIPSILAVFDRFWLFLGQNSTGGKYF